MRVGKVMQDRQARLLERLADADATLDEMFQRMTGAMLGQDGEPVYEGLPAICREWDVSYGRVMTWLMADAERYAVYNRALAVQAKALVAETVGIADSGEDVARDKLRVETRFRVAKYHDAAVYGDKGGVGGGGIRVVVNRGVGNPSGSGAPACDAVSIEAGGQTLTISGASGDAAL